MIDPGDPRDSMVDFGDMINDQVTFEEQDQIDDQTGFDDQSQFDDQDDQEGGY